MTDNEVYITIIEELIKKSSHKKFKEDLQSIIDGLRGKDHVEEQDSPQYKSIELWGNNIFPFKIEQYRKIAEYIKTKRNQGKTGE